MFTLEKMDQTLLLEKSSRKMRILLFTATSLLLCAEDLLDLVGSFQSI